MSEYIFQFLWALRLSARKSEVKRQTPNRRFYNLFCGSNFVFGTVLGRFSQCNFEIGPRRPTMVATFSLSPPP